jgi:hypothetical protein
MKNTMLKSCLLILLFVGGMTPKNQAQLMPVDPPGLLGIPDTVQMGDTLNFTYRVVNAGLLPLINPRVFSIMRINGQLLPLPVDSSLNIGIYQPGDTIPVSVNQFIISPSNNNNGGGNVLVVWPSSDGFDRGPDSLVDNVYVLEPTAIRETRPFSARLTLYPNPAVDRLNLTWPASGPLPLRLEFHDLSGKTFLTTQEMPLSLDLSRLPRGIYFLVVDWADGLRSGYRVSLTP